MRRAASPRFSKHRGIAALALLGALGLVGCAPTNPALRSKTEATAPRMLRPEATPIHAERIEGEFTLLDVPVGDVVVRICPSVETEPATLETRMRAAALIRAVRRLGGTARTLLDANGSSPTRAESEIYDGKTTRSYQVRFGPGASFEYEYSKTGEPMRRGGRTLPVETAIHDVHSALLLLRNWQPRLDEEAQFTSCSAGACGASARVRRAARCSW